jgi:hypothetical protein
LSLDDHNPLRRGSSGAHADPPRRGSRFWRRSRGGVKAPFLLRRFNVHVMFLSAVVGSGSGVVGGKNLHLLKKGLRRV